MMKITRHMDKNRNQVSFRQMKILKPVWQLNGDGGTHTEITAQRLVGIKKVLTQNRPDRISVHSNTNVALTDVLCASKLHIPVLHTKSGWHSCNRRMPKEINRVMTDHLSVWLCCPIMLPLHPPHVHFKKRIFSTLYHSVCVPIDRP
jgi:UDP-N-acetylglucosamine 2-epimerase